MALFPIVLAQILFDIVVVEAEEGMFSRAVSNLQIQMQMQFNALRHHVKLA